MMSVNAQLALNQQPVSVLRALLNTLVDTPKNKEIRITIQSILDTKKSIAITTSSIQKLAF